MLEDTSVIEKAEAMTFQKRVEDYIDVDLRNWINTTYKERMKELVQIKNRDLSWYTRKIELSNDLSRALYCFVQGSDFNDPQNEQRLDIWNKTIEKDLFGDTPDSVVNYAGKANRKEIQETIIGSITTLTFIDLLTSARPDLKDNLAISQVVSKPKEDAEYKVDFKFLFGDRNPYYKDAEIERLAQLKGGGGRSVMIWWIDPENMQGDYRNLLKDRDPEKMLALCHEEEKRKGCDARAYVVQVPSYDPKGLVDNVFGIVTRNRRDLISDFERKGRICGLLPEKEVF